MADGRAVQSSPHVKALNEKAKALLENNANFINNSSFLQNIAALRAAQDPNQPAAAQTVTEVKFLERRCVDLLAQLQAVKAKQGQAEQPVLGNSRRSILVEKRKQLQTEVDVLRAGYQYQPDTFSDMILLEKIKHELTASLTTLDETDKQMGTELQQQAELLVRTKKTLAEMEEINAALHKRVDAQRKERHPHTAGALAIVAEIKSFSEQNGKLMTVLAEFLDQHYPKVAREEKKKKRRKDSENEGAQSDEDKPRRYYYPLRETLQELLSRAMMHENDPYITITESYYAPYIELLVRSGIAEKHPTHSDRLRLFPFHK